MTEISDRTLRAAARSLFENPVGCHMPVLTNLFRYARSRSHWYGASRGQGVSEVGKLLAYLKEPEPPKGFKECCR